MQTNFGEFLATKRKEKGLTQKDLANILYVSESTISKWEKNRANPDISMIPTLADLLGVSEHELITASIDTEQRENNKQAKKWRNLTFAWNLIFLVSYGIVLVPCFICNLAVGHTLSWFWIVLASLMLSASFTNLPRYVKKFRLLILSTAPLLSLILLLGICCIYSRGNWFIVTITPIIFCFLIIFLPIYIKKYNFPIFVKKHCSIITSVTTFVLLVAMLYIIQDFALKNNYTTTRWATKFALPLCLCGLCVLLVLNLVWHYLKVNGWFKTSLAFLIFAIVWLPAQTLAYHLQYKIWGIEISNYYLPNFDDWSQAYVNGNVNLIIVLSLLFISISLGAVGLLWHKRKNKNI